MENEFKLPSNMVVEKQKMEAANKTVIVEALGPCYVNNTYHAGGVRFMCDKSVAEQLVADKCAFIVEG
jgi:hypothetical protein